MDLCGSLASQPSLLGELHPSKRHCLKQTRLVAPEEWYPRLSIGLHMDKYMDVSWTHVSTDTIPYIDREIQLREGSEKWKFRVPGSCNAEKILKGYRVSTDIVNHYSILSIYLFSWKSTSLLALSATPKSTPDVLSWIRVDTSRMVYSLSQRKF